MGRNKEKWLNLLRAYGLNALVGFSLGVGIVIAVATFSDLGGNPEKVEGSGNTAWVNQEETSAQNLQKMKEDDFLNIPDKPESENSLVLDNNTELNLKDRVTVLLIGVDNRPGEIISNTDTLIVASVDNKNKKMVLLSIPRDTQVMLGSKKEKINAIARLQKGPISTQKYIQDLLSTPMDGYILTNFQGFKNIVDSLGGITINVEKDMYYDTGEEQDRYIDLKKGLQRLNGNQALQYARFRNDELADISRASRQQEVIKAILAEATTPRNLPKLPLIIPQIYQAIETNLDIKQIWALAMAFKNQEDYNIINQTLPGQFSDEEGISYWKINPQQSKVILNQLFNGQTKPVFENIQKVNAPAQPQSSIKSSKTLSEEKAQVINESTHEANKTPMAETQAKPQGEAKPEANVDIKFSVPEAVQEEIVFEILD